MTAWLLTYLLHSTLFLALTWLAARGPLRRRPALEEAAWRFALVAALVTASVQLAAGYTPLAGRWGLGAPSVAAVESPAAPAALHLPGRTPPAARIALRSVALAPTAPVTPAAPLRSLPWSALLAGLWMAGAVALGARWLAAHLYLSRRLRARPEVVGGDMHRLLSRLAGEAGLGEQVRLSCSSRLPVPIALGLRRREICVPPRALASLSPEQQEGMLAHELAHLVRRDPFWLAFSHFLASVLFVQPLNFVARRRLRELSELRSDEWAVGQTGRPLSLARCLAEVAGWSFQPLGSLVAPGMADRPSHLAHRIRRLLSDTRSPENRVHPLWLAAGMAILLVTVVAAAPNIAPKSAPKSAPAASSPAEPSVVTTATAGDSPVLAGPGTPSERSDRTSLVAEIAAEIAPKAAPKIAERAAGAPELAGLDDTVDRLVEEKLSGLDAELDNLYDRDHLSEADEKELNAQISAIDAQIEQSMKPSMEEAEKRMDAMMKEFANSRTWKDLEARAKELEQKSRLSDADIAKITANAEKMAAESQKMGHLTEEQREAFRKQAREMAKQAREMAEMGRLTDKERAEIDELSRKVREEQQRFMKDHAAEIETMRQQIREQAARMREEIKRRVESDPKLKEKLDRHLSVMDKERADERKKRRDERERLRKEEKDHSGAVSGGVRGGVKGGVAGGVEGGVVGGVAGGVAGGVPAAPPAQQ